MRELTQKELDSRDIQWSLVGFNSRYFYMTIKQLTIKFIILILVLMPLNAAAQTYVSDDILDWFDSYLGENTPILISAQCYRDDVGWVSKTKGPQVFGTMVDTVRQAIYWRKNNVAHNFSGEVFRFDENYVYLRSEMAPYYPKNTPTDRRNNKFRLFQDASYGNKSIPGAEGRIALPRTLQDGWSKSGHWTSFHCNNNEDGFDVFLSGECEIWANEEDNPLVGWSFEQYLYEEDLENLSVEFDGLAAGYWKEDSNCSEEDKKLCQCEGALDPSIDAENYLATETPFIDGFDQILIVSLTRQDRAARERLFFGYKDGNFYGIIRHDKSVPSDKDERIDGEADWKVTGRTIGLRKDPEPSQPFSFGTMSDRAKVDQIPTPRLSDLDVLLENALEAYFIKKGHYPEKNQNGDWLVSELLSQPDGLGSYLSETDKIHFNNYSTDPSLAYQYWTDNVSAGYAIRRHDPELGKVCRTSGGDGSVSAWTSLQSCDLDQALEKAFEAYFEDNGYYPDKNQNGDWRVSELFSESSGLGNFLSDNDKTAIINYYSESVSQAYQYWTDDTSNAYVIRRFDPDSGKVCRISGGDRSVSAWPSLDMCGGLDQAIHYALESYFANINQYPEAINTNGFWLVSNLFEAPLANYLSEADKMVIEDYYSDTPSYAYQYHTNSSLTGYVLRRYDPELGKVCRISGGYQPVSSWVSLQSCDLDQVLRDALDTYFIDEGQYPEPVVNSARIVNSPEVGNLKGYWLVAGLFSAPDPDAVSLGDYLSEADIEVIENVDPSNPVWHYQYWTDDVQTGYTINRIEPNQNTACRFNTGYQRSPLWEPLPLCKKMNVN